MWSAAAQLDEVEQAAPLRRRVLGFYASGVRVSDSRSPARCRRSCRGGNQFPALVTGFGRGLGCVDEDQRKVMG